MIEKYNDNELLYLISENNEIAFEILYKKYRPLIINRLQRFRIKNNNFEDYLQECLIELYRCAITYREDKSNTFNKYLDMCIQNKIKSILRSEKNYFYKVSFVEYDDLDYDYYVMNNDINNVIEDNNDFINVDNLLASFSIFEKRIYEYIISGKSIEEIVTIENKDSRSIYNAIARVKLKKHKASNLSKKMIVHTSILSELETIVYKKTQNGMKPKEIADNMKWKLSRVYNTIKRIKNKIRRINK